MKKHVFVFLLVFGLAFLSTLGFSYAKETKKEETTFVLPLSLEWIDEEAFAGTAVQTVIFPDGLRHIGEKSFYASPALTHVYIPSTVKFIGEAAFPSNEELTIYGIEGSFAEAWAAKHQVVFVFSSIWGVSKDTGKQANDHILPINLYKPLSSLRRDKPYGKTITAQKTTRPQDRPEFNPIDYKFP